MRRPKFLLLMGLALMVAVLPWGGNMAFGNTGPKGVTWYANSPSGISPRPRNLRQRHGNGASEVCRLPAGSGAQATKITYFSIFRLLHRRAVPCSRIAIVTTSAYVPFTKRVHSDLPLSNPTHFRGYVDLNVGTPDPQYLGPLIVAAPRPAGADDAHQRTGHGLCGQSLPAGGHHPHGGRAGAFWDHRSSR